MEFRKIHFRNFNSQCAKSIENFTAKKIVNTFLLATVCGQWTISSVVKVCIMYLWEFQIGNIRIESFILSHGELLYIDFCLCVDIPAYVHPNKVYYTIPIDYTIYEVNFIYVFGYTNLYIVSIQFSEWWISPRKKKENRLQVMEKVSNLQTPFVWSQKPHNHCDDWKKRKNSFTLTQGYWGYAICTRTVVVIQFLMTIGGWFCFRLLSLAMSTGGGYEYTTTVVRLVCLTY